MQGLADDLPQAIPDPALPGDAPFWLLAQLFGSTAFWVASIAFWLWMLVHCIRHEPDRTFWIWILILFPVSSAAYFLLRWLPNNDVRLPGGLRQWTRRREIERLETAALQIGNPYQHVQLGDALRDLGLWDRAGRAYADALVRDHQNVQALWGAALVDLESRRFDQALERLDAVLAIDPQYKFGDVSLARGRALLALGHLDEAARHLEGHVQRWRHPEGMFLLAEVQVELGRPQDARRTLQAMLLDINACHGAMARRYGVWKSRARKLLKRLPPPPP